MTHQTALLPGVLFEGYSPFEKQDVLEETIIPKAAKPWEHVSDSSFQEYREKRTVACADVIAISPFPEGPRVSLSLRKTPPMSGQWWSYGGTMPCYAPLDRFLHWALLRECGLTDGLSFLQFINNPTLCPASTLVSVPALIGVYRVPLSLEVPDAIVPVGLAIVDPTLQSRLSYDSDHKEVKWFSRDRLANTILHPYISRTTTQALKIYNEHHRSGSVVSSTLHPTTRRT